ncbi:MAG TPA: hypothetical protein VMM38_04565 [Aridibacter sp.]|nr:hypothetical protein [Aridibacter sp.]
MRAILAFIAVSACLALFACGDSRQPATPVETLKAYTIAMKSKDITMMKLLLSEASLKLHQEEAKARGVTVDEIVQQQTLFAPDQRVFDYRNEKIEGDTATVEVKNSFGGWDTVHLVRENGAWKIDRKGTSDRMIEDIEKQNQLLEQQLDDGGIPTEESPLPEGEPSPVTSPSPGESPEVSPSPEASLPPATMN